jgi:hypothetical protein
MSMTGELYRVSPRRLKELLADPGQVHAELYPDEGEVDPLRRCTVEKTWDAIEFILRRLAEAGRIPWIKPITEGKPTGAELHYGGVVYRTADEVRQLADVLRGISKADFAQGYAPEAMTEAGVYPQIWDRPEAEENFQYVWSWFEGMVDFYRQAADAGDAMLLHLG